MKSLILTGALIGAALAQSGAYGQCGGIGWTGATTCVSGYVCTYLNAYYSQCVPGTATTTSTTTKASTTFSTSTKTTSTSTITSTSSSASPSGTGFEWFGVNESGAEFGEGTYPGVWGTDFIFPNTTTIGELMSQGFNIFRLTFAMERMTPSGITGAVDPAYLANLTTVVDYITSNGGYAIVDPHNFGRFNGNIITSTSDFGTWWTNVATPFKSNSKVIFDTNNEYHDEDQTLVLNLNQAAIDAIRATGATSQYIFAEGNGYSGAWVWNTTNNNLANLTDTSNKLIYEMHQYFDSDGSGTSATCVSSTIGVERVVGATEWLRANGKVGILGEYGAGANSVCEDAVQGLLEHLEANSDVWKGALWWAAGPWWGTYIYSFEPPTGTAYEYYDSLLTSYVP